MQLFGSNNEYEVALQRFKGCLLKSTWRKEPGGNFWSDLPEELALYADKVRKESELKI